MSRIEIILGAQRPQPPKPGSQSYLIITMTVIIHVLIEIIVVAIVIFIERITVITRRKDCNFGVEITSFSSSFILSRQIGVSCTDADV